MCQAVRISLAFKFLSRFALTATSQGSSISLKGTPQLPRSNYSMQIALQNITGCFFIYNTTSIRLHASAFVLYRKRLSPVMVGYN